MATILEAQRDEQLAKEEEEKAKTQARLKQGLPINAPDTYLNSDDVFGWVPLKERKKRNAVKSFCRDHDSEGIKNLLGKVLYTSNGQACSFRQMFL